VAWNKRKVQSPEADYEPLFACAPEPIECGIHRGTVNGVWTKIGRFALKTSPKARFLSFLALKISSFESAISIDWQAL
jgi:hypothetical protein